VLLSRALASLICLSLPVTLVASMERVFAGKAATWAGLAVFTLALLGVCWSPGMRATAGAYDIAALLAVPFILYAASFGTAGRVFGVLAAGSVFLFAYWAFISQDRSALIIVTARLVEGIAFYWLAAYCFSRASLVVVERIVLAVAASLAVAAVALPRLTGQLGHYGVVSLPFDDGPVHAGVVFVMLSLWCLLFVDTTASSRLRLAWGALYGIFVALTLWSLSRVSIVAVGATLLYLLWRRDWRTFLVAVVAAAILFGILLLAWPQTDTVGERLEVGEDAVVRWFKWIPYFEATIASVPQFLFGSGPGSINALYPRGVEAFFAADTQYLRSLVEFGLVGSLFVHGTFLLQLVDRGWQRRPFALFITFLAVCGAFFVTHEVLMLGKPMTMIYLVAGSLIGLASRSPAPAPAATQPAQPEQAN
jgi:hypothetical protein